LIEIIAVQRNRAFRTIKQDPDAALVDAAVADDCPLLTGKPQAALGATVVNPYTGPDVDFTSSRPSAHYAVSSEVFKTGDDILRAINKNLAATVIATGRASIKENKTVRGSAQGPGLIN
jgi:hypothetical protein